MSLNLNLVTVAGTLTREPEIKFTPKGTAVAQIGMAINSKWTDDQGNKHEDVTFLDIEAFGATAKTIGDYCHKGHTICIEGKLKLDQWEDKQSGQKRSKLKVIANRMHFVSVPKAEQESRDKLREQQSGSRSKRPEPPPRDPDLDPPEDDDIPY